MSIEDAGQHTPILAANTNRRAKLTLEKNKNESKMSVPTLLMGVNHILIIKPRRLLT
jgi:hypothetical protein